MYKVLLCTWCLFIAGITYSQEKHHYLFSYFVGNGEDVLHLAYSTDGYQWNALKEGKPLLTPTVGKDKLMRDPSVVRAHDGTFHMVWTVSWGEKGLGTVHPKISCIGLNNGTSPLWNTSPMLKIAGHLNYFTITRRNNILFFGQQLFPVGLRREKNINTITGSTTQQPKILIPLLRQVSFMIRDSA